MKITTRAKKINERIERAIAEAREQGITSEFAVADESVQAEVRLIGRYSIRYGVDHIHYPKNLAGDFKHQLWAEMRKIESALGDAGNIATNYQTHTAEISARTKAGPALRADDIAAWTVAFGLDFLARLKKAITKTTLKKIKSEISRHQAEQKALLKKLRAVNSEYLAGRKTAKAAERAADARALKSGQFWKATRSALKGYFTPPFDRNYLADVSEQWRAALFLECESISFKTYHGNWGHKLGGTGNGYLCGIDDNGDEWGHDVRVDLAPNDHGDGYELEASVEDAMAELFGIDVYALIDCQRQGDLLFCAAKIPTETHHLCTICNSPWEPDDDGDCSICQMGSKRTIYPPELHPHAGPWEIRESHAVESDSMERNGRYFRSANPIHVSHTSHAPVTLPAGEYRLYELQVADAD